MKFAAGVLTGIASIVGFNIWFQHVFYPRAINKRGMRLYEEPGEYRPEGE